MKNVTISMKEDLLRSVRIEAAGEGKSVSRFLADLIAASIAKAPQSPTLDRHGQIETLERILSGPRWSVMREGRMPTADERNER